MDEAKLKDIRQTEKEAGALIAGARQDYERIVREAAEEGEAYFLEKKQLARMEAVLLTEKLIKEGRADAERIFAGLDAEIKKIERKAGENNPAAVDWIKKNVMPSRNNL
jgi:vacuolar-type H+-ATPase subunit H